MKESRGRELVIRKKKEQKISVGKKQENEQIEALLTKIQKDTELRKALARAEEADRKDPFSCGL